MQNDMVSIPSANMNGGLKAANSSGTVVGVGVGVAGTVLTNAQRVYLTPASSYHLAAAARQTGGGATATVVSGGGNVSSGVGGMQPTTSIASTSSAAHGTVRYFSQFSKLQPVQQLNAASVGQRKLLNGDTMVLVNGGSKPLIFATTNNNNNSNNSKLRTTTTATAFAAATTVPNGNRVFINKQQLQQKQFQLQQHQQQQQQQQQHQQQQKRQQAQQQQLQQQQQPVTVIDERDVVEEVEEEEDDVEHVAEEDEEDDDTIEMNEHEQEQQQQQKQPLALLTATTATTTPAEETATTITTTTKCNNDPDAEPELDIVINNVVCSFSVRCHLKLREIALNGSNVEYRRENGMVTMKLRRPYTTASIWSSGRITCTGATSESQAKIAARRYARCLSKLGFPTHFQNFRIVNVLGTCSMPWAIKIVNFSERHRDNASYEPELHPGVTYKMREPKATLKIFSTGSITVTAASVNDVESAIQHIYPLVHEFRKQRSAEELQHLRQKQRAQAGAAGVEDPTEVEDQLCSEAKNAAKDDIFVNTTAAHTNATRPPGAGATSMASVPLNSMRRLEQYKQFHDMQEQTQIERRHIPFAGSDSSSNSIANNNNNTSSSNNNSSSSTSDNICANARRRATECWASKLQNKRPRYNDPSLTSSTGNSGSNSGVGNRGTTLTATLTATTATAATIVNSSSSSAAALRLRGKVPVDVVLKQSSSRARNAAMTATAPTAAASASSSALMDGMCVKRDSFSPTDFQVDDLIEEDDDEDMDLRMDMDMQMQF